MNKTTNEEEATIKEIAIVIPLAICAVIGMIFVLYHIGGMILSPFAKIDALELKVENMEDEIYVLKHYKQGTEAILKPIE